MCQTLRIKQLCTSVYHPQANGLVERLNGSIKKILCRCIQRDPRKWDLLLPLVLFVLRDTPSESLKYSPFELVLGHRPRGLLQTLREEWERNPTMTQNPSAYRQAFQHRVQLVRELARSNLLQAQQLQKERYNAHSKEREFKPGQKVLVLLPTSTSKLLTQRQGPFEILRRVGPVDYEVHRPGHFCTRQIYRVNLLREWCQPEGWATFTEEGSEDLGSQGSDMDTRTAEALEQICVGEELMAAQKKEAWVLLTEFKDIFTEEPGWVQGMYHSIRTPPGSIVRDR